MKIAKMVMMFFFSLIISDIQGMQLDEPQDVKMEDATEFDIQTLLKAEQEKVHAKQQAAGVFEKKLQDFYQAIGNADLKAVEEQIGISGDPEYKTYAFCKPKDKQCQCPTVVAFTRALEEKDQKLFARRCEILLFINRSASCRSQKVIVSQKAIVGRIERSTRFLHKAVAANNFQMVVFLLDAKISTLNEVDDDKRTALFFAQSKEMAKFLILKGAWIDVTDTNRSRPHNSSCSSPDAQKMMQQMTQIK